MKSFSLIVCNGCVSHVVGYVKHINIGRASHVIGQYTCVVMAL